MCEHASVIRLKTLKVAEHNPDRPISASVWASTVVIVPNIRLESENCGKKYLQRPFILLMRNRPVQFYFYLSPSIYCIGNLTKNDLHVKSWVLREIFVRNAIEAETTL